MPARVSNGASSDFQKVGAVIGSMEQLVVLLLVVCIIVLERFAFLIARQIFSYLRSGDGQHEDCLCGYVGQIQPYSVVPPCRLRQANLLRRKHPQGNSPASEGRKNDAAAGAACGAGPIAALKLQELEPVRKRVQLFDIA
jgi:hypothetical protein